MTCAMAGRPLGILEAWCFPGVGFRHKGSAAGRHRPLFRNTTSVLVRLHSLRRRVERWNDKYAQLAPFTL